MQGPAEYDVDPSCDFYALQAGLAYLLNRISGEQHCVAGPSALIGASNFFELAVAAAISLFGFQSGAALATVVRAIDRREGSGEFAPEWWTHKGSNLGPLPCEGNALPLSYASGNGENQGRQSPRFTKDGPSVSSEQSSRNVAIPIE